MPFLSENMDSLKFEWNAASEHDWPKIKRLFVAAYVGAYKERKLDTLDLNAELVKKARDKGFDPLTLYFVHEFKSEYAKIKEQYGNGKFNINYLTVKFHDQPIAFIVSQLNFKSGRVYIRWNTVSPSFQNQGLGKMMLAEVAKFYDNAGLELYTRRANTQACNFYARNDLTVVERFNFDEPTSSANETVATDIISHAIRWLRDAHYKKTIFPPLDEKVSKEDAYIGFCKTGLRLTY